MMKRLAAIAAMSLVAFQAVSGVAMGVTEHLGSGTTPLVSGGTGCPTSVVLGVLNVSSDSDVTFQIDSDDDQLDCGNSDHYALDDVERVVVYGNGKNSQTVDVEFNLEDAGDDKQLADFGGIEFSVRTDGNIVINGSGVEDDRDDFDVTLEDDAFSVDEAGLEGTVLYANSYEVEGGAGDDTIDGRKVTAVDMDSNDALAGGDGNDVIYGGAKDDELTCDDDSDPTEFGDQCWGGDGDDTINADAGDIVAPGDGDDEVNGDVFAVTYADSSAKVAITVGECGTDPETESDAGDDDFDMVGVWYGSSKGDTFVGSNPGDETCDTYAGKDVFYGQGGNDRAFGLGGNDTLRGGAGNDVLKGGSGSDKIRGDSGSDEAWGGKGKDACGAEVTDSCEFLKG